MTTHQYFGSGAGIGALSNFASCELKIDGRMFPSSEHAYQAMAKVMPVHWHRFAVGGDLSTLETGLKLVFKSSEYDKKFKHYKGKGSGRPCMVGIVAKMAVRPDVARKLGLRLTAIQEQGKWMTHIEALFERILHAKYDQNPMERALLVGTGDRVLVEFSRGAERETKKGKPPLWTGMVVDGVKQPNGVVVGGSVVGQNLQGRLQMQARDSFK